MAKTYFIDIAEKNQHYFLKLVDKPLWIVKIIRSLPALLALKDCGIEQISCPILTISSAAYILRDEVLLVVFIYIQESRSYDYDTFEFRKLLGKIHAIRQQLIHLSLKRLFISMSRAFFWSNITIFC